MKFTYDKTEQDRECVAYIDDYYLIIYHEETGAVALSKHGIGRNAEWKPHEATQKFYKGDSVTITF